MKEIATADLAHLCQEESERYRHHQAQAQGHCYELFRRAIAGHNQEAWTALYAQYRRLLAQWIGGPYDRIDERINGAWGRFWKATASSEASDEASANFIQKFDGISQVLTFLRLCAQSERIDDHRREAKHRLMTPLEHVTAKTEDTTASLALNQVLREDMFAHVEACLRDSQERLVMHLSFELGLKPTQIAQERPDVFADVEEVRRVKERMVLRLSNDVQLQTWWKSTSHLGK
jgi:DNA-directed RNA polymerase specialized sigma24 family protein